ncbi:MAG: hypothetical protein JNJ56_06170 [Ignavibacteria bacterium]|nr:hypothetical protein [Ignavibacteria bacterium]
MKKILLGFLILFVVTTFFSCANTQVSTGIGFGVSSGPYGYGSHWGYPSVNVGVYGGGYRRFGY